MTREEIRYELVTAITRRRDLYIELGKAYYEHFSDNPDPEFEEIIEEIQKMQTVQAPPRIQIEPLDVYTDEIEKSIAKEVKEGLLEEQLLDVENQLSKEVQDELTKDILEETLSELQKEVADEYERRKNEGIS